MEICITIAGKRHCFYIPIYVYPIKIIKGPGPVNYPAFFADATLVASLHDAINQADDAGVKAALQGGIAAAVKAMQKRAGDYATINMTQQ
jgi:hypothetical protein